MAEREVCLKVESEEFCCRICMEEFDKGPKCPRTLLCSHCFCHSCIETLILESPICPLCREPLDFKKAEKFPISFPVLKFMESYQRSLAEKKVSCSSKKQDQSSPSDFFVEGFCEEHKNTKQFKCMDCSDWVCGTCALLHHKKCRTLLVKEALKEMQNEEVKKIDDVLKFKFSEEKCLTKINEIYEEGMTRMKKEVKELQLKLKEKIRKLKYFQEKFHEFLHLKEKRKKLWIPVEKSEMKKTEFVSNDHFEISKSQLESELMAVNDQQQDLRMIPSEISAIADYQTIKHWLDGEVALYAVRGSQIGPHFSRLELRNGKVGIHCFQRDRPTHPFIAVPFRELLLILTGSCQLPSKAFFEIGPLGATRGQEVIVQTDAGVAGSPRVQNFLLLVAGLKGASYKWMSLVLDRTAGENMPQYVRVTSVWKKGDKEVKEAVVKGIEDFGIYGRPKPKRGFVGGDKADSNSSLVAFFLEDLKYGSVMVGKFGEVESGLEALDQMKSGNKLYVISCGFIVDS